MRESAKNHYRVTLLRENREEYALSVATMPDASFEVVCAEASEPHPRGITNFCNRPLVRRTTVGALSALGYETVSDRPPHGLILLPNPPGDPDYERIEVALDLPEDNPSYRGEQ